MYICVATELTELRGAWTSVFLQLEAIMLSCTTVHVTLYKGIPGWFSIAEIVSIVVDNKTDYIKFFCDAQSKIGALTSS
jgi:hypothetical protein